MLSLFIVRRVFNQLRVSIVVDLDHKDAEINLAYAGRLKRSQTIPFDQVCTIEKAEAALANEGGVYGTYFAALEREFSSEVV